MSDCMLYLIGRMCNLLILITSLSMRNPSRSSDSVDLSRVCDRLSDPPKCELPQGHGSLVRRAGVEPAGSCGTSYRSVGSAIPPYFFRLSARCPSPLRIESGTCNDTCCPLVFFSRSLRREVASFPLMLTRNRSMIRMADPCRSADLCQSLNPAINP